MEDDWFSDPDDMRTLAVGVISDTFVQLGRKNQDKRSEAKEFIDSVGFELWVSFTWFDVDYLRSIGKRIEAGELTIKRHIEWCERPDMVGQKPWTGDNNRRRSKRDRATFAEDEV